MRQTLQSIEALPPAKNPADAEMFPWHALRFHVAALLAASASRL